jgi:ribosomal protein L34E
MICPRCYKPDSLDERHRLIPGFRGVALQMKTMKRLDGQLVHRCGQCGYTHETTQREKPMPQQTIAKQDTEVARIVVMATSKEAVEEALKRLNQDPGILVFLQDQTTVEAGTMITIHPAVTEQ